ncbi:3-phenylpropionate/cinnamic acid dioxygenase small subunit [Nocardia kruczakiae]|uniref:3-phenylpropionate/cinnamic acid dioxygenase small subunit n=1 Tax=Nocardia kruczakiae TaxID=261477 RepID=A0ABU1XDS1_9NOCA|nr:nuclear transport factor 2 family protein [Nocardia kruczakiae]MDR7168639.1 3-phenylpropionate/cinnamic acid dioxygenase small subunit [Nocardia kruczakiae]
MPDSAIPSYRAIERLIADYALLVDQGDFAGVGALFATGAFGGSAGMIEGSAAVEKMLSATVIRYDDGTPRTKHLVTNLVIDIDEDQGTATARSYFTVLQATPDLPLQPIVSGRYADCFHRPTGQWAFAQRAVTMDLIGDVGHHLRR